MSILNDFIDIINSKIGSGYLYGGQSDAPLTKEKLNWFVNTFGKEHYYFKTYNAEKWIGKEYYDCSGLIVYALIKIGLITPNEDYSSETLYKQLCKPIDKSELKAGDLCFRENSSGIVHVGVYMGNSRVTQARDTLYGVVNTELFDSFNLFGRLKFFMEENKMSYEEIIKKVADSPDEWIKGINSIKSISCNLGDLDIFKYLPELIEKIYNNK